MRYLTGIQPSGEIHLGNYLGAIKPIVDAQNDDNEVFIFIPNYHALTSVRDGELLRSATKNTIEVALASGLNKPNTTLYVQSQIPEIHELTWYLSCLVPVSDLERAHAFKDKILNGIVPNHGLMSYPVLMAADILMFHADIVPVGKDQKQHVEFARDWAIRFNNAYGETFVLPESQISEELGVLPGIDGRKMSKSYKNEIPIFDSEERIKKQIMKIVTDSTPPEDPKDPEKCLVFGFYKLVASPEEVAALAEKYRKGGIGYGEAKLMLFDAYMKQFGPLRAQKKYYEDHPEEVTAILETSYQKIRKEADACLNIVRKKVGIWDVIHKN